MANDFITNPPSDLRKGDILLQGKQWLRQAQVLIAKRSTAATTWFDGTNFTTGKLPDTTLALDVSDLHFRFQTQNNMVQTPNMCTVRIYNISPETAAVIVQEYDQISVSAGYPDTMGVIFSGSICQYKRGRENATDTYIELIAATADLNYNFGFMNTTLGKEGQGATWQQFYAELCQTMGVEEDEVTVVQLASLGGGWMPRGAVAMGLARAHARTLARAVQANWSIQTINGVNKLVLIKTGEARPGTAIVLGPDSGLVGVPEATVDGVMVRCLLNPLIQIGTLVQIAKELIAVTDTPFGPRGYYAQPTAFPITAPISPKDLYQVAAADHVGDSRGQEWYTDMICVAVNLDEQKVSLDPFQQANALPDVPLNPFPQGGRRGHS